MISTPLARFFETEYSSDLFDPLASAPLELDPNGECVRKFEFNLFEITFDAATQSVTVEDVLDGSEEGAETVTMREFAAALESARYGSLR